MLGRAVAVAARRDVPLGDGQCHGGRQQSAGSLRRFFGTPCPAVGDGRHHPYGVYSGIPANEIVLPIIVMDMSREVLWWRWGNITASRPLYRQRLDLHGVVHRLVLPLSLSLFHHPTHHQKGNRQFKMDSGGFGLPVLIGMLLCALAAALRQAVITASSVWPPFPEVPSAI